MPDMVRVREALRLLRQESDAFVADLESFEPADWDRLSTCPPWTVRQLASHVIRQVDAYIGAVRQGLDGRDGPAESREARIARMNEIAAQEPAKILADARETNGRFESWFGALDEDKLDVKGPHAHGPRSAAWFIDQRLCEVAFHRSDLERSLGGEGDFDQETARHILPTLLLLNVPSVIARDQPEGSGRFVLCVRGEPETAWTLTYTPGCLVTTPGASDADATLEGDAAALVLLMYGRASWPDLEAAGRLSITGDRSVAERAQPLFRGP